MQRAAGPVLLWKHLERYGPRHADVNPSRKVHCEHQRISHVASATLCIVSLERDGEGNFCRVGVATGDDRAATGGGRRCKPQCAGLCAGES